MGSAADARSGQDQYVVEVLDPLDPVEVRRGEPQEPGQMPLALRNVRVVPSLAGLQHADPVALLRGTKRGNAAAEPGADDQHVVVEALHRDLPPRSPDPGQPVVGPVGCTGPTEVASAEYR
jgi:hypothetical protein